MKGVVKESKFPRNLLDTATNNVSSATNPHLSHTPSPLDILVLVNRLTDIKDRRETCIKHVFIIEKAYYSLLKSKGDSDLTNFPNKGLPPIPFEREVGHYFETERGISWRNVNMENTTIGKYTL